MIIKIFKISTLEMVIIRHKRGLTEYIKQETGFLFSETMTINQLMKKLPVEEYYRIK